MLKTATETAHLENIYGTLSLVCSRYCRIIPMNLCKIRAGNRRQAPDDVVGPPGLIQPPIAQQIAGCVSQTGHFPPVEMTIGTFDGP